MGEGMGEAKKVPSGWITGSPRACGSRNRSRMAGLTYSVGSVCAYWLARKPLFFFLQEAVDLLDQLQQLLRVLLICGFSTQMLPTFSGFTLHGMESPSCLTVF